MNVQMHLQGKRLFEGFLTQEHMNEHFQFQSTCLTVFYTYHMYTDASHYACVDATSRYMTAWRISYLCNR